MDEVCISAWGRPLLLLSASLNIIPVCNVRRHLTVFCKLIVGPYAYLIADVSHTAIINNPFSLNLHLWKSKSLSYVNIYSSMVAVPRHKMSRLSGQLLFRILLSGSDCPLHRYLTLLFSHPHGKILELDCSHISYNTHPP